MEQLFSIFIPGRPVSKKNTQRVVRRHGLTLVVYSKQFKDWEKEALLLLRNDWKGSAPISEPMHIDLVFNLPDRRQCDVSNLLEAPQDALTKAGVIKDDSLFRSVTAKKNLATQPTGTTITLYKFTE